MRCKSKNYQVEKPLLTADIGDLLWRQQASSKPAMVLLSHSPSQMSSEESLSNQALMAETRRVGKLLVQGSPPVTEDRLKAQLDDLLRNIAADIN
ncbi:Hypothetical predicted protein [Pelobates cultripes]|uniref:Uncharacterized protein n=1 Tax=Pelobates cultripes TaxID=61616 RepID=A0AAD1TC57_PELCU|nr:Hypothetical predicted protein [Pelobates cultripes]